MPGISKLNYFKQFPRYQFSPVRTGNAMISTANKKFGVSSFLLDGTGDFIQIYDTGTAVRPGDFTIELWSYVYSTSTSNGLFDWRTSGSNLIALAANINTAGNLRLNVNGVQVMAAGTVNTLTWNHIALVRNGSTTRWFLNGVAVSSFTDNNNYSNYSQLIIGGLTGGSNPYRGYIDEFRYSRIARYTGATTFTPSTTAFTNDENTVLLLHFNDYNGSTTIVDDIGDDIPIGVRPALSATVSGNAQISTSQYKFGSSSGYYDGTGDSIRFTNDTLCIGQNDFTIEMWAYVQNISVSRHLYDQRTATTSQVAPLIRVYSTGLLSYFVNGLERIVSASNAISTNTWYHIAVCRSGTSTRMFLDGVQVGSTFTDTFNYLNLPVSIGSYNNGTTIDNSWQGYIDEVRLSNIARYTANFTPPSTAFTHDDNTVLLLHMEGSNGSTTFTDSTS